MVDPAKPSSPPILPYGRSPRFSLRRRSVLLILLALGLGIWLGCETWYKIPYWRWALRRHAEFQSLLSYTDSPAHLVYEDSPLAPAGSHTSYPRAVTAFIPPYNVFPGETLLFLHQRSAGGHTRLVKIAFVYLINDVRDEGLPGAPFATRRYWGEFTSEICDTALLHGNVQSIARRQEHISEQTARLSALRTFKLFAGQPDPADPARFTIDCELNGKRSTITGTLNPDGKTLTLTGMPSSTPPPLPHHTRPASVTQ